MLQDSWPSKDDIETLVNHSGGLWIYTATLVRFIGDPKSSGPDNQLHAILRFFAAHGNRATPSKHPLLELHEFYTLIMQSVPPEILRTAQRILLLVAHSRDPGVPTTCWRPNRTVHFSNILGLTEADFRYTCSSLHSVLELGPSLEIRFHHASFVDFLQDPERSERFCIYLHLNDLHRALLERLNCVHSRSITGTEVAKHVCFRAYYANYHYCHYLFKILGPPLLILILHGRGLVNAVTHRNSFYTAVWSRHSLPSVSGTAPWTHQYRQSSLSSSST